MRLITERLGLACECMCVVDYRMAEQIRRHVGLITGWLALINRGQRRLITGRLGVIGGHVGLITGLLS